MNVYDSSINIWKVNINPLTGVLPILAYSATFLDGLIIYIGGRSGSFMNEKNSIDEYSFNTVKCYFLNCHKIKVYLLIYNSRTADSCL